MVSFNFPLKITSTIIKNIHFAIDTVIKLIGSTFMGWVIPNKFNL